MRAAGAAEGEDDMALGRLGLEHVDQDRVADVERRLALAMTPEQLPVADHALALRADVDEDLVLVDPDDLALDDVAVLEALDVGVLLREQLLHRRRLGAGALRRGRRGLVLLLDVRGRRCVRGLVLDGGDWGLLHHGLRDRLGGGCLLRLGGGGLLGHGGLGCGGLGGRLVDGDCRLGGLLGGGLGCLGGDGLVGDGNRRDGLLGRRGLAGGNGLRGRRGPVLLLFGQGDRVSCRGFGPWNHETAPEHIPAPSWRGRVDRRDLGRRSAPSLTFLDELFNCPCPRAG